MIADLIIVTIIINIIINILTNIIINIIDIIINIMNTINNNNSDNNNSIILVNITNIGIYISTHGTYPGRSLFTMSNTHCSLRPPGDVSSPPWTIAGMGVGKWNEEQKIG